MSQAAKRRKPKPTILSLAAEIRTLKRDFAKLREELRTSELGRLAAEFSELNERRATDGVARVAADLKVLREKGIVDEHGNRISKELPKAMTDTEADVV